MLRQRTLLAVVALAAAGAQADTRAGRFQVDIQLVVPGSAPSSACTSSSTGSAPGGGSVQVRCRDGVFVDISRVSGLADRRFIRGVQPVFESEFPDFCRDEPLGYSRNALARAFCTGQGPLRASATDADEDADGRALAGRLYAEQTSPQRWRDADGSVTSLHVSAADSGVFTVELLVSF